MNNNQRTALLVLLGMMTLLLVLTGAVAVANKTKLDNLRDTEAQHFTEVQARLSFLEGQRQAQTEKSGSHP